MPSSKSIKFRPAVHSFFWPSAPAHFWRSSQGSQILKLSDQSALFSAILSGNCLVWLNSTFDSESTTVKSQRTYTLSSAPCLWPGYRTGFGVSREAIGGEELGKHGFLFVKFQSKK